VTKIVRSSLTLREHAYQQLRRLLLLQQVPEGLHLREPEWSARLKVNRTALRESFARLAAEGLIETSPRGGYCVASLTNQDLVEVVEVRIVLEGGAIERLIGLGLNTPEHLKAMSDTCGQLERLVTEDYLLGVPEADRRFHVALIDASGNKRMAKLYHWAPLPIIHPHITSGEKWMVRVQQTLEEHKAILAAILEGNAAGAKQLLRIHLNESTVVAKHAVERERGSHAPQI